MHGAELNPKPYREERLHAALAGLPSVIGHALNSLSDSRLIKLLFPHQKIHQSLDICSAHICDMRDETGKLSHIVAKIK